MKFFVTGASGVLGAALVKRLLADGHEVVAYLRHRSQDTRLKDLKDLPITFGRGALLDTFGLKKWMKGCDGVFHVAGLRSWQLKDRQKIFRSNVESTRRVVEVARELKIPRIVITSSVLAVGLPNRAEPIDESFVYNGHALGLDYPQSKHDAEAAALSMATDGVEVVIVNPGVILMPESKLVEAIRTTTLRAIMPGGAAFVGLEDAVDGHVRAFFQGRSKERYILASENLMYRDAIAHIARHLGKPAPTTVSAPTWLKLRAYVSERLRQLLRQPPPLVPYQLAVILSGTHFYSSQKAQQELGWTGKPVAQLLAAYG